MMSMDVADILDAAADLLEKPGAWAQGTLARDAAGNRVGTHDSKAVCFCIRGALWKLNGADQAEDFLGRLLPPDPRGDCWSPVVAWNDAPERTQAEVVSKLREAASLARTMRGEVG